MNEASSQKKIFPFFVMYSLRHTLVRHEACKGIHQCAGYFTELRIIFEWKWSGAACCATVVVRDHCAAIACLGMAHEYNISHIRCQFSTPFSSLCSTCQNEQN
jgi:hypothetical protein